MLFRSSIVSARRSFLHNDPTSTILSRDARLHHRGSLGGDVLLDLAVDEAVEEVVERVLLEVGRGGDVLSVQELIGVEDDGGVEVVEERDL